ncbi:MAG TPA: hypothetical protein VJG83_05565 [archaeon]|nr:hypothetical protein [archaeon]
MKRDFPHMLDESLLRKMTTAQLLETFGNRVDPQIRTEMRGIEDALRQGKYTPTHFSMGLKEVRERIIVAIMGAEKR